MNAPRYVLLKYTSDNFYAIDQQSLDYHVNNPIWTWHKCSRPLLTTLNNFQGYTLSSLFEIMKRITWTSYCSAVLREIRKHHIYHVEPEYRQLFRQYHDEENQSFANKIIPVDGILCDVIKPTHSQPIATKIDLDNITSQQKPDCYYFVKNLHSIDASCRRMGVNISGHYQSSTIVNMQNVIYDLDHIFLFDTVNTKLVQVGEKNFVQSYYSAFSDFIEFIKPLSDNIRHKPLELFDQCIRFLQGDNHNILVTFRDNELADKIKNSYEERIYKIVWQSLKPNPQYILSFANTDDYLEFRLSTELSRHLDLSDFMEFFR